MATEGPVDIQLPQSSWPMPPNTVDDDDLGPVPVMSPDSQSFVVIRSAADIDDLSDDNDIADMSLLHEHKQLLQEELARFDLHSKKSNPPSVKPNNLPQDNEAVTDSDSVPNSQTPNSDDKSIKNSQTPNSDDQSIKTDTNTLEMTNEEKSSEKSSNGKDVMVQSILSAMPQPQVFSKTDMDEHDSRAISIVSFAPSDFGSEEIQAKVTQLIDENTHLKDTIIQNNISMKAQYDKIVAWKKDVEKVHQEYKEKLEKAKKCIETQAEENRYLKDENDKLRQSLEFQKTEHDKTKMLLTESSENNIKEFELDMANNKIKALEDALEKLTIKSNADLVSETAKWKAMEEKLQRYEKELENAYKQIRDFEKGVGESNQSNFEKLKLAEEKLLISEMANERANKEIVSLRNQLARQMGEDSTKMKFAIYQISTERDKLLEDLAVKNAAIIDAETRFNKLENELHAARETIKQQQDDAKMLRDKEEQANIDAWMTKQKLSELESRCQFLQATQAQVHQIPQYPPEIFNPGELAFIRQQLMQSQKALTDSEHNRAVAEAQVNVQKNEIAELRRQIDIKANESDDLYALRAQLDVYKIDFEAEREAKEENKRQMQKATEDLQHLHRRNQQMQEEIELLREQLQLLGGSLPTGRAESGRSRPSAPSDSPMPTRYTCPICNISFRSLKMVQDHLDTCICHAP